MRTCRSSFRLSRPSALGLAALFLAMAMPLQAGQKGPPRRFEARPDSALVYFIRPHCPVYAKDTARLFDGDRFIGVLDDATYFAAYLPPGSHVFWTESRSEREAELIAGQTFYVSCSADYDLTVVDRLLGEDLLAQGVQHVTPVPKELENGASQLRRRRPAAERPPFPARPESALIYFIRPAFVFGPQGIVRLFADDQFLGVLDKAPYSGAYFASYLPPGNHVFWMPNGPSLEMDLTAGRTYHLGCSLQDITVLDDQAVSGLFVQGIRHDTPDPKEVQAGALLAREHSPGGRPRGDDGASPAAAHVVPRVGSEGGAWLPKWTRVHLELLEAITSAYSATGEPVLFEVTEDVVVDGAVVIARGTSVQGTIREGADPTSRATQFLRNVAVVDGGWDKHGTFHEVTAARPGSVGGVLEVVVASVPAMDGTQVPVIGLPAGAESERERAATGMVLGHGIFGKFALPGFEAYHLRGEKLMLGIREDTWLATSVSATALAPAARATHEAGELRLAAQATTAVDLRPGVHQREPPVIIAIHADSPIESAVITSVGGRAPSHPPSAVRFVPFTGGTTCDFEGWSVARLLDPSPADGANHAEIRGALADGRRFVADLDLTPNFR